MNLFLYLLAAAFAYQMMPLIFPVTYDWPNKMPHGALPKRIVCALLWPVLLFMGWFGTIVILYKRKAK